MMQLTTTADESKHQNVISHFRLRRVSLGGGAIKLDQQRMPSGIVPVKLRNRTLIQPSNPIYRVWQLLTMLIVCYQSFALPFYWAFLPDATSGMTDSIIDVVFVIDLLLNFNLIVPDPKNPTVQVRDRRKICKIYFQGWFFIDLLASIPFDQIAIALQDSSSNLQAFGLLKGLRLPRLLRLVRLLRVLKVLRINPELKRWLQYSRHANLLRLVRLIIVFLSITHFMACIWQGTVVHEEWYELHIRSDTTQHAYLIAFYTSLLLIMGENIEPLADSEVFFSSIALLLGAVMMAIVFGNVAVLIANFTANTSAHQKKMEEIYSVMRRLRLPNDLQTRIEQYYREMWDRHGTLNGQTEGFVDELSSNLASEVMLFMRMEMITSVPFLHRCNPEVVHELVMQLRFEVYLKDDYIAVVGELGSDMYFVQAGQCTATIPSSTGGPTTVKQLYRGDYFGEIAMVKKCKRTANVKADTFVELCVLSREVFEKVTGKYVDDRKLMIALINEHYEERSTGSFTLPDDVRFPQVKVEKGELADALEKLQQRLDSILTKDQKVSSSESTTANPTTRLVKQVSDELAARQTSEKTGKRFSCPSTTELTPVIETPSSSTSDREIIVNSMEKMQASKSNRKKKKNAAARSHIETTRSSDEKEEKEMVPPATPNVKRLTKTREGRFEFSLFDFLYNEIFGIQAVEQADARRRQHIYNFLTVPLQLEKLVWYGFFVSFDCFLYVFTILPIRILMAILSGAWSFLTKRQVRRTHIYDILRALIIGIATSVLACVDISRLYHSIRGQEMIKLYVLFTMIEIFDKLCCSLGQDILDALYFTTRCQPIRGVRLLLDFMVAAVFVVIHSLLLFAQVVTFNAAIDSSSTSLLTLLISNNFAEIKTSVFKRFEEQNLFQIACSDIVERFKLVIILGLILLQATSSRYENSNDVMYGAALMLLAEVFVDWIKHAFITKFNRINAGVYDKYISILCRDITGCRKEDTILDHTHYVSRRLGLVPLPLAAVVIRMLFRYFSTSSLDFRTISGCLFLLVLFLCCVAAKVLTSLLLMAHACRSGRIVVDDGRSSPVKARRDQEKLDELAKIERYQLYKSRIV